MQKKPAQCSIIVYLYLLFNFVVIRTLHPERVADQKTELETLKFVHVLWRHGARTPAIEMAKEPREWKQGLGELTTKGMGQLYRLGQWIRRRYDGGFLSPEYNSYELYVRSSDFNRTLMSAQALLAGLYPPRTNKTFAPDLNWQPFPVHTESREIDR
uniref:Acid phosphatase n=1 Tax=Globodera pallida TaxID=36090 RepID=A0A183CQS1_GLOPA